MAEVTLDKAIKIGIKTQKEFAKEYGNVSLAALDYAMSNGIIDYTRIGTVRHVVLTERSLTYSPNKSVKRPTVMSV